MICPLLLPEQTTNGLVVDVVPPIVGLSTIIFTALLFGGQVGVAVIVHLNW